ncbi:MAG: glutamate-cysteine ligase family protein [Streptosporangiaceae bacterium]
MPHARRTLTTAAAEQLCAAMFAPSAQRIGLELEWPVHGHGDVTARPGPGEMSQITRRLPRGSRVTFEPGGQVELSTAPQACVADAIEAARADEQALRAELAALGLTAETMAVDDRRPPRRVLEYGRYSAMEQFFSAQGNSGRWMMCNTASTQVNLSHDSSDPHERWYTMNLVAPVLIAGFANSPGIGLGGDRWASVRQGIWWSIDRARTRPVCTSVAPESAWLDYALAADVMFVCGQGSSGAGTAFLPGTSFGSWMTAGHAIGWPTVDDLRYHLSTLFPPVRPRGWLELRVLDALPGWVRDVAALTVATAGTSQAGRELRRRLPSSPRLWTAAARHGLRHPVLGAAARELFAVVLDNLGSVSDRSEHMDLVEAYRGAYIETGRMPGDDLCRALDLREHAAELTSS